MQKKQPKFIGIGGSGTGLGIITNLLQTHPQVNAHIPALNFFNNFNKDKKDLAWYEDKMGFNSNKPLPGECSPDYLRDKKVAPLISEYYPDTKLFVVVRNPIDRVVAEYMQKKATGKINTQISCGRYLVESPIAQIDSFYAQNLYEYFSYYSPLQLYILIYEDFVSEPLKQIQKLYEFLDLDKNFVPKPLLAYAPPPDEPINPGKISRLIRFTIKSIKKLKRKTKQTSIFLPEVNPSQFLTVNELALFSETFAKDASHLSGFLHRDMVVFWNLKAEAKQP